MIEWVVGYAIKKRVVMAMIGTFAVAYGYYAWTHLAVEAYPDIAEVMSQVIEVAPMRGTTGQLS